MKEEILNQNIRQIYFSEDYSSTIYSVFIDLDNGDRFRLINRGVSYSDCANKMDDLLPIYVDSQVMPRSFYIGQKIVEIRQPENDWASIILENGVEIGIRNNSLRVGTYVWTPEEGYLTAEGAAPPPSNKYLIHYEIVNYFKRYGFGTCMPVLTHLSLLRPSDRIFILEKLLSYVQNINVYDKLSMAYAKNGQLNEGLEILEIGRNIGQIEKEDYQFLSQKIQGFSKTQPMEYQRQKDYISEKLSNTEDFREEFFLQLAEKFIDNNYAD